MNKNTTIKQFVPENSSPEQVREYLIINHVKLVYKLAHKYKNPYAEFDDLCGQGILALHKAANTFDFDRNVKFITYAFFYIRKYIIDYINKERRQKTISDDHTKFVLSLDAPINEDSDTPFGSIAIVFNEDSKLECEKTDDNKFLHELISEFLTPREQVIVKLRFMTEQPYSLTCIAKALKLPTAVVKNLEIHALNKLRKLYEILDNKKSKKYFI
jgi:RNA polymerase sigma factor (sigma-70 family)